MRVSCEVTVADFAAFRAYVMSRSPMVAAQRRNVKLFTGFVYGVVFALALIAFFAVFSGPVSGWWITGSIAGGVVLGALCAVFYTPASNEAAQVEALHRSGELKAILGQKTVELQPEHYVCANEDSSVVTRWRAIERVEDAGEHIFVLYTPSSACIVPKRAFQDAEQVGLFLKLAQEYHRQARAGVLVAQP